MLDCHSISSPDERQVGMSKYAPGRYYLVTASRCCVSAANVVPTLDTTGDVDPTSAAGLPLLDYEDPPQLLDPAEDEDELKSQITDEEEPEVGKIEESVEKAGQQSDELPEDQAGEDAEAVVAVDVEPQLAEQPEAIDFQDNDLEEYEDYSGDYAHADDDDDADGTEFDNQDDPAEQPPEQHLQSAHSITPTAEVLKVHTAEPEAEEAVVADAVAADSSSSSWASPPVSFSVKEGGSLVVPCARGPTRE